HTPPPPWGQGWRKGGCGHLGIGLFLSATQFSCPQVHLFPKFSGKTDFGPKNPGRPDRPDFRPEKFPVFQLSNQKKYGRKNFNPKSFPSFNFRGKDFPAREISRPKKDGFSDPMTQAMPRDLRRNSELVAELTPFFSTFAPDFFGFFNFQPENFLVFQISNRKKSGQKNFAAKTIRPYNFRAEHFWPEKFLYRTSGT
ncbi:MAG: hypothetical protein WB284_11565, partial [Methanoregula sp.]|uniref:hypothetical protein n=1 Tax=Methanoregula sp. TaxID=2052170 RepID=UPI003C68438C